MKKFILIIMILPWALNLDAQGYSRPSWIVQVPEAGNDTYYYKVTTAEGKTYSEAYSNAFSMAILEGSWRIGITFDTKDDLDAIKEKNNIIVSEASTTLRIHKVCEYEEELTHARDAGVRIWILWQMPVDENEKPKFDSSYKCN